MEEAEAESALYPPAVAGVETGAGMEVAGEVVVAVVVVVEVVVAGVAC